MSYRAITGRLVARTAVHVGSGRATNTTDALLRRNGAGEVVIPGTAIAGALRSLSTRLAPRLGARPCKALEEDDREPCGCLVCELFGDINQSDKPDSPTEASKLLVFDAHPSAPIKTGAIRDSVGIDRSTGAAARATSSKFDLEVLGPESSFELRIELRDGISELGERLLAMALAEWKAGRLWLGGRVVRGLGAFRLEGAALVTQQLQDADGLIAYLKADKPWEIGVKDEGWIGERLEDVAVTASASSPAVARAWVRAEFTLAFDGPFLTNDAPSAAHTGFDHAPLLASSADWKRPVLPGAGLRGALRSHAERIARTLATYEVWGKSGSSQSFGAICPACDPLARRIKPERPVPLESCDSLLSNEKGVGGDETVSEDQLCLGCRLFGSTRRGSRLIVEDAQFCGEKADYKMLDFLAIDRFTGGGAEGLKFDALVLWRPAFRVRMHLDNPQPWELGWLALALRDLKEGLVPVGYGAAKGFGRATIADDWELGFGLLDPANDLPGIATNKEAVRAAACRLADQAQRGGSLYCELSVDGKSREDWLAVADHWVQAFYAQATGQEKEKEQGRWAAMPLPLDSYFDRDDLVRLYPVIKEE